jgi:hypothetical protein
MRADAEAICDALREVHIPPNSPAVLPHTFEVFTLKNYLSVLKLPDPAELLENFFQLKTALLAFAREEKKTIQRCLESRKPPKRRVLATFSIPGARQYALKMLFSHCATKSMPKNQIESRIAQILMAVDNGVLKIDPYRKDCAAVQKAIQRLADRDKERIDRRLRFLLNSRGSILIRDSKNGQPRHIPMDSTVRDVLSGYIPTAGSEHVFPSASGGRLSTVQKAFRNARIRAGMPDLHFHDLRHTFASHWVMSGGDLYVLKDILGHKSIQMTQRYAHLSPTYKRAMVDRMEKMWEEKPTGGSNAQRQPESASTMVSRHTRVTNRIPVDRPIV